MSNDFNKVQGRIFDIQRYSIHDGPGIRAIVFLKGCFLRCRWCCNPESQEYGIEQLTMNGKTRTVGRDVIVSEVMDEVLKDLPYYRRSGGGLTLSGGECLFQPDFAAALLEAAQYHLLNTAIESTACAPYESIQKLLPYLDLFLMDIKHMDSAKHRAFTIGPCIAKKSEVIDSITFGGADYAMTYEELASMFEAKNIDPEECTETLQQGSKFGKQYSVSGGVTAAVLETFKEANKEVDLKVKTCSGALECKKALMLLKVGKLPEDFIEGMACVGGCVNGPAMLGKSRTFLKDRNGQIAKADDRGVLENVAQYDEYGINMTRNHQ